MGPGGETALCDFKKVYDNMDLSVRKKFEDKGVWYAIKQKMLAISFLNYQGDGNS